MHAIPDRAITYCTNIHPGESWAETFAALQQHVPRVKAAVSAQQPFPIGLRLSNRAAVELDGARNRVFTAWLEERGCFVPTLNGFPFGRFHGGRIKEAVYLPDWRSRARVDYTLRLADLLCGWLPEGDSGSISTVPLGFKTSAARADDPQIRGHLETVLTALARLKAEHGKTILLALEPEPGCLLETTDEVCRFFTDFECAPRLRDHLGICYDCCHQAVQFEDPAESLQALSSASVPIAKVQVSSALRMREPRVADLALLHEPSYLHQVVVRRADGTLFRYPDLPDAVSGHKPRPGDEWRCHFHVPIFRPRFGTASTTQDVLEEILPLIGKEVLLEVETYTWEILPEDERREPVSASIIREMTWLAGRCNA